MASIINASPTNGIVQTADGSGLLKIQSNSVTTNALAWVNFNGTGTVAIRSSYNVSSITDNGTGDYTVNFATALSDANYSAQIRNLDSSGATSPTAGNAYASCQKVHTYATTSLRFYTFVDRITLNAYLVDCADIAVTIHGN